MGTRNHGAKRAANGIHGRMKLNQRLYEVFRERAEQNTIEQVCIGLAYTAVAVSGGGGASPTPGPNPANPLSARIRTGMSKVRAPVLFWATSDPSPP